MESERIDFESDSEEVSSSRMQDNQSAGVSSGFQVPAFQLGEWQPLGGGVPLLSLVPMSMQQDAGDHAGRTELTGKMRICTRRRKERQKHFKEFRTSCRNVVDERRLRTACNQNDYIAVVEMLDGGADASCPDDKMRTPLHIASSQGYETIVKILLDRGADPNRKDFIGNTPLHLAACTCQVPIVTLLLKAGTNIKSVDQYGRTPLTLAKSRLKFLGEKKAYSNDRMRSEIIQISDMMKTYLDLSGCHVDAEQLDSLCQQLERTTTREQVDHVNDLMSTFATMTIEKKNS